MFLDDTEEDQASPQSQTQADLEALSSALESFQLNNAGRLPATLEPLVEPDEFGSRYLKGTAIPLDAWGRAYRYSVTGQEGTLWSIGPNGIDEKGEGDDLTIAL